MNVDRTERGAARILPDRAGRTYLRRDPANGTGTARHRQRSGGLGIGQAPVQRSGQLRDSRVATVLRGGGADAVVAAVTAHESSHVDSRARLRRDSRLDEPVLLPGAGPDPAGDRGDHRVPRAAGGGPGRVEAMAGRFLGRARGRRCGPADGGRRRPRPRRCSVRPRRRNVLGPVHPGRRGAGPPHHGRQWSGCWGWPSRR